jgi:hypothetical protein
MNRQEQEDKAQLEYLRKWKEKKQKRKNDRRQIIKLCEKKARKNGCPECCEQCDLNTRGGYRYETRNLIREQGKQILHEDVAEYIARKLGIKSGGDTVGDDKRKTGSIQK